MKERYTNKEIDRLAERLRSDSLEPQEAERIRDIIRHHPVARRRLVEHLYLAADLGEVLANWREQVVGSLRSKRWVWGTLGSAAAAVVALVIWQPGMNGGGAVSPPTPLVTTNELDSAGIAVIAKTSKVKWGEGTTLPLGRLENGSPAGKGVLEILEGVVQIDFYSGATVILEGPAKIELVSPELGRLAYGNLWAHVPPPARGFKVETSSFDVIDLGTEFGMTVGRDGKGEVHVIDGEVEVMSSHEEESLEKLLRTGEGVQIAKDGSAAAIDARPGDFLASKNLSAAARDDLERWKHFQSGLMKDPDVLVGYLFQEVSPWERAIVNRAEAAPIDTEGAIVGCERTTGRWVGKGALGYRNSSHRVRLNLPGAYKAITLACWVKVDALGSAEMSLLHPETTQDRYLHWTLVNVDGRRLHLHFAETAKSKKTTFKEPDRNHYHCDWDLLKPGSGELGEWMHLATVFDPERNRVTHYQNGQWIGENKIKEVRELGVGIADIGNWPYHEWAAGTEFEVRNLNGAIDEFLIMKRAWTPEEIQELWEAGKP